MNKLRFIVVFSLLSPVLLLAACGVRPNAPLPADDRPTETQARAWQLLGTALDVSGSQNAGSASVALDASGQPIAAWGEYNGTSFNVYVKRWQAGTWSLVGANPLDVEPDKAADRPSLAVDSRGNPVVAWREADSKVYVKRFDGVSWDLVGTAPLTVSSGASTLVVSLTLDGADNPIVAWDESGDIYVKRWDGTKWVLVGAAPLDVEVKRTAYDADLAVDAAGQPVVVWQEANDILRQALERLELGGLRHRAGGGQRRL